MTPPARRPARLLAAVLTTALTGLAAALAAVPDPAAAGAAAPTATRTAVTLEVATTNLNTYRAASGQRDLLRRVLSLDPDVVLVQEVGDLHLARERERTVPGIGEYAVVQDVRAGSKEWERASAILFRTDRFGSQPLKSGFRLGYSRVSGVTTPPARFLPWARLKDQATGQRVNVVSVHMPTFGTAAYRRAHARMRASYQDLVRDLRGDAGLPVVVGGDYNNELHRPPSSQPSVAATRAVGLRFGWADSTAAQRRACPSTIKDSRTRRIDGVAYPKGSTLVAQRCLALKNKDDHRPVVVEITLEGTTR